MILTNKAKDDFSNYIQNNKSILEKILLKTNHNFFKITPDCGMVRFKWVLY